MTTIIRLPDFIIEVEEFRKKLERYIGLLYTKEREVFLLSRIDKKALHEEISEIINSSAKAIERNRSNAFITLRKLLRSDIKI